MDPAARGWARALAAPSLGAFAALAVHAAPGAEAALRLDRHAVLGGEVWRVLTCHLAHGSAEHLLWDVAMFLALGVFLARRGARDFLGPVLLAAVLIPAGLLVLSPGLDGYEGLSGLDSALFVAAAAGVWRDARRERRTAAAAIAAALVALFVAKVAFEVLTGAALFVDLDPCGLVPVPLAHLLGAVAGLRVLPPRGVRRSAAQ